MTEQTFSVLLYTSNEPKQMHFGADNTCEAICRELCRDLDIKPISNLLFSLRIKGTAVFLSSCRSVKPNEKYELRLRHKVPNLSDFKKLDIKAYNYYYHQAKYDLVNNAIAELVYPNHKDKVAGLAIASMYIEMLEHGTSIDELVKHYKQYVPKKHVKEHPIFIKKTLSDNLRSIKKMDHDPYFVKSTYLESINRLAPSYLREKYKGTGSYLSDDNFVGTGTCQIDVTFQPFRTEHEPETQLQPGLNVYYYYKKDWRHLAKIEDILSIIVTDEEVKMEIRDCPDRFFVKIKDKLELESFVSCLNTYYRLMVKWTANLCPELASPTLQRLRELKCHGPIGGEYSYSKLHRQYPIGAYIIRQCERIYENYYIDIIVKPNHIETYKITEKFDTWHLHSHLGTIMSFSDLPDLARSIKVQPNHRPLRVPPSDYEKIPSLLLCLPPQQVTAKQLLNEHSENELRKKRASLFNPVKDLRKIQNSQKLIEGGIMTQMRAEWILPEEKKLDVTLKILNSESHSSEFQSLASKWSDLNSSEFIKMYGFTLSTPHTLVFESARLGTLDEYLQQLHVPLSKEQLIEAALTLARALHYLHDDNIIHGRIRCASLHVVRHDDRVLIVRLGDPGIRKTYTDDDLPWIPFEYHHHREKAKTDFKAEMWAFATTLWEIFSQGRAPTLREFYASKRRLLPPVDCPEYVYEIMREGWDESPDKRYSPQALIAKLMCASQIMLSRSHYTDIKSPSCRSDDKRSINSTQTGETIITNGTDSPDRMSNSSIGTISEGSNVFEATPLLSDAISERTIMSDYPAHDYSQSIVELMDGVKLIYQGEIGRGHYGIVYKGQYEKDDYVREVAIKRLKGTPDENAARDFELELNIMKCLQHPNIVRIITSNDEPSQILIVMEYVRHGSLYMYLNSHSPLLKTERLLKYAKDIASGMQYLVSKKIVHRDLAARNVLVDTDGCIKISDFGLARVADNGYYVVQHQRDMPIKWYAPEVLGYQKYSFSSDVWSYGVTLFEMFSGGQTPNLVPERELTSEELLDRLNKGERLKMPINKLCTESIYDSLLMSCWCHNPKDRPTFTKLLQIIHDRMAEYGEDV